MKQACTIIVSFATTLLGMLGGCIAADFIKLSPEIKVNILLCLCFILVALIIVLALTVLNYKQKRHTGPKKDRKRNRC